MISSVLILVLSAALLLFYLQSTCERILQRSFEDPLPEPIVEANALQYPLVRKGLTAPGLEADCWLARARLESDCRALTHLLKHAANERGSLSSTERLLALYFRALSSIAGIGGRPVLLKMTAVLEYFANVLGERAKSARFAHATGSAAL
jgi:hypothetical protein